MTGPRPGPSTLRMTAARPGAAAALLAVLAASMLAAPYAAVAILAVPAAAQAPGASPHASTPAEAAMQAAGSLADATAAMQAATTAPDRVAALAGTLRAFEAGLDLLREDLRNAALREATLQARFDAQSAELARLLGVLGAISRVQADAGQLAHPAGPLGTARAAMLLGDLTPALAAQAGALKADLREAAALREVRTQAQAILLDGLDMAQAARSALGQAMSERAALPAALAEDPAALTRLALAADTLDAFARSLTQRDEADAPSADPPPRAFAQARGTLALPAHGLLLRAAGAPDAAGIVRPGMVLATGPGALVSAPWSATVRYAGPLRGYGNVIILEPAPDYLLVLGGLDMVYVRSGEIVAESAPVGLMPDDAGAAPGLAATGTRTQSLYLELREHGQTVDPAPWFALTAQGG